MFLLPLLLDKLTYQNI